MATWSIEFVKLTPDSWLRSGDAMNSIADTKERSGNWMPFRFLYFIYYVLCSRDKRRWPWLDRPTFNASGFLVFALGWPIYALLNLLDYFTGWVPIAAHYWTAMHFPVMKSSPETSVFVASVVVIDLAMCVIVFNKKRRYQWIMNYFGAYDLAKQSVAPASFTIIPLLFIMAISILSTHANPVRPNMIIWSILACTELAFRSWWHSWSKRNVLSQHGRDASQRNPGQRN